MKYMNDHDIDRAWRLWQLHPVLGPAVRTVQNLRDMADANSDGWAYWRAPCQAAAKVIDLIERDGTSQYAYDEERADATAEEYKRALRPLKAFRTRMSKAAAAQGSPMRYQFQIVEPLEPAMSGELWVAKLAAADAFRLYEDAKARERAVHELLCRANLAVREAQRRADAARYLDVLDRTMAKPGLGEVERVKLEKVRSVAAYGTRVWLLPSYDAGGMKGLGTLGTSLGLTGVPARPGDSLVAIRPDGGRVDQDDKMLYAWVVSSVADVAGRWWIVSADGRDLVSGGLLDRGRCEANRDERHPDCLVQQGAQFMPEAELRAAGVEPVRQEVAL